MNKAVEAFLLNDKVALVTGAAGGIGTAISEQLAKLGATVILTDINEEGVKRNAEALAEKGLHAEGLKVNILEAENIKEAVSYVKEKYGKLDILANAAGSANDALALETSDDEWRKMIALNLDGSFYMSREFGKLMSEANQGTIINISSIAGIKAGRPEHHIGYDVAKAGIVQMTKTLASELASHNIRVNAVAPGYTNTAILQGVGSTNPEVIEMWKSQVPQNRLLEPEEIANAIAFLASDAASAITGQTIMVDGGYSVW